MTATLDITAPVTADGRPSGRRAAGDISPRLAGAGAHSYSEGDATGGSEEAARFKG